eukprot:8141225-Pyramimonas_sp.AAC.2
MPPTMHKHTLPYIQRERERERERETSRIIYTLQPRSQKRKLEDNIAQRNPKIISMRECHSWTA